MGPHRLWETHNLWWVSQGGLAQSNLIANSSKWTGKICWGVACVVASNKMFILRFMSFIPSQQTWWRTSWRAKKENVTWSPPSTPEGGSTTTLRMMLRLDHPRGWCAGEMIDLPELFAELMLLKDQELSTAPTWRWRGGGGSFGEDLWEVATGPKPH